MDIRQLNAFVAVFEERNITAAAQRLFTSQPTLSVTIRQLEEALGTTLFQRLPRGVEVTDDARTLYPQARRLVAEAQALGNRFRRRHDRLALEIGVEGDIADRQLDAFLGHLREAVPNVQLTLQDGCVGDARLAVEESCCEDELFLPLWEEPYVLALGTEHPLSHKPRLDHADLVGLHWVTCPGHPSHQRLMEVYNRSADSVAASAGNLHLVLRLLASGAGAALLPRSLTAHDGITVRPAPLPHLSRRVGLCYAAQALDVPALRLLHGHLQGVFSAADAGIAGAARTGPAHR